MGLINCVLGLRTYVLSFGAYVEIKNMQKLQDSNDQMMERCNELSEEASQLRTERHVHNWRNDSLRSLTCINMYFGIIYLCTLYQCIRVYVCMYVQQYTQKHVLTLNSRRFRFLSVSSRRL